jgi:DNA-binding NarL/FixJ family response regulator
MAPIDVVGTAEDEVSAVSWLAASQNRCDLVVVDIFLKSGSGLGVLKAGERRAADQARRPQQLRDARHATQMPRDWP